MVRAAAVRDIDKVRADAPTTSRPASTRGHERLDCPRCMARLLFDGEKLACLMCGYEHATPPRLRGGPRSPGELLDALPLLRSELSAHVDSLGAEPQPESPGYYDLNSASASEQTALQFGRLFAQQSLVSAGHSLIALARGLEPPTPEYGTWSVSRTVLNSASLVCWLLDPGIGRRERAQRSLALHAADLEAECQFLTSLLSHRRGAAGFTDALDANRVRRQELAALTADLGGTAMVPDATERAGLLGAEFEYLMCSSILDGRPWALLHATAFRAGNDIDRASSILTTQVQFTANWYARAVWSYVCWMSPDTLDELESSLEFGFDSLVLPDDLAARFWRERPAERRTALAS